MLSKEQKQWTILITLAIIGYILYSSNQLLTTVLGRIYLVGIVILATKNNTMAGLIVTCVIFALYMNTWYSEGYEPMPTPKSEPDSEPESKVDKLSAEEKLRAKSANKSMYQNISTSEYADPAGVHVLTGGKQLEYSPF